MPFIRITGTFLPGTGVPDGDTVRFAPDNPELLFLLRQTGMPPNLNEENGTIALRYEGIDAMEKEARVPESSDATARNLALLGLSGPQGQGPGYIYSRQLGPHGRPICWAYPGAPDGPDGGTVFVNADHVRASVNHQLLAGGHAYPLFYDTLFHDLRLPLTEAVKAARLEDRGLWQADASSSGILWTGAGCLPILPPLFPKIWRRLEHYTFDRAFRERSGSLDAFPEYLQIQGDRVLVLPLSHFTGLDNVLEVQGNQLKLDFEPEDLVFRS